MEDKYFGARGVSTWIISSADKRYIIDYHNSESVTIRADGTAEISIDMQINDDYGLQKFISSSTSDRFTIERFRHVKGGDDNWYNVVEKYIKAKHLQTVETCGRLVVATITFVGECEFDSISLKESDSQCDYEHQMNELF